MQTVDRGQLGGDDAQHDADFALLNKDIDPKAPDAGRRDGEVALLAALEISNLPVVHDRTRQGHGVLRIEWLRRYLGELSIDLDGGRKVSGNEQVAAVATDHQSQQVGDELGCLIAFHKSGPLRNTYTNSEPHSNDWLRGHWTGWWRPALLRPGNFPGFLPCCALLRRPPHCV